MGRFYYNASVYDHFVENILYNENEWCINNVLHVQNA